MANSRVKIYLGLKASEGVRQVFRSFVVPTTESHGHLYNAVVGPFRTVRAANFMRDYGANNPHCVTVNDAEKLAAQEAAKLRMKYTKLGD